MMNESPKEMEPFQVPKDFAFELEFHQPSPRKIPPEVRQGKHARNLRIVTIAAWITGILLLLFSFTPLCRNLSHYLLPLQWLYWIAIAILIFPFIAWAIRLIRTGPYRYIRDGVPVAVRILDIVKKPTLYYNSSPSMYAFETLVEFQHPDTGQLVVQTVRSNDFGLVFKDNYNCTLKCGQYVTGLYLQPGPETTLRLYGFLELHPNRSFIEKGSANENDSVLLNTVLITGFVMFFASLIWALYAMEYYMPIDFDFREILLPASFWGLAFALIGFSFLRWDDRRSNEKIAQKNKEAIEAGLAVEIPAETGWNQKGFKSVMLRLVILIGFLLLGACVASSGYLTVNALLDNSPPTFQPTQIKSLGTVTHNAIVRLYQIEYFVPEAETTETISTSKANYDSFIDIFCILEIHQGRLGWPWVKNISPILIELPETAPEN